MILTATTQSLEMVLSGTSSVEWSSAWTVIPQGQPTFGSDSGILTTTSPVTLLPAPAVNVTNRLESIDLFNGDVLPVTVTLRLNSGGSYRRKWSSVIPPGGSMAWTRASGWTIPTGGAVPSLKQMILNPQMDLDQRNAGASVTINTLGWFYTLDRWATVVSQAGKILIQQQASALPGVAKYARVGVASAFTAAAGDFFEWAQPIEGFTAADLAWGTSQARGIVLTFRVRSTIAGTYSVAITSGGLDHCYVTTFTVAAANTWERKTIFIPGDTSGTWGAGNAAWGALRFDLGSGTNFSTGNLNTWQAGNYFRATGTVALAANAGATFDLTDVRMYAGNAAPDYDQRLAADELDNCLRYYQKSYYYADKPGSAVAGGCFYLLAGANFATGSLRTKPMRSSPNVYYYDLAGTQSRLMVNGVNGVTFGAGGIGPSESGLYVDIALTIAAYSKIQFHWTMETEL